MKLDELFRDLRIKPRAWAKENSLPKDGVYRVYRGERVNYDTAKRISQASGGKVSVTEIMEPS